MRIICLEEHVNDPAVAAATRDASSVESPYSRGLCSHFVDDPSTEPADRPRLLAIPKAMQIGAQSLDARIAAMDAAGIDMHVLSLCNELQLADSSSSMALCRDVNNRMAAAVARYPGRLSGFFALPWQDPAAAVREAARCVNELGLPATLILGRPAADVFLDDARFDPVLAELARLDAPLYVHPGPPMRVVQQAYYAGFNDEINARLPLFGWGWHNEAGVQTIRLILSGALDRHRGLKLISGHWGEMVPFFLQRMDDTMPPAATGLERPISQIYREQVWVTPSGMLGVPHFMFIREVLGIEHILFSVDYPFLTMTGARSWLESLPIAEPEKAALAHGNAQRLLHIA